MAIISILAAVLLPALARAKDKAKTAACSQNLRALILATLLYEDEQKVLPVAYPSSSVPWENIWYLTLQPYLGKQATTSILTNNVMLCPACPRGGYWGFRTYSQNNEINFGRTDMNLAQVHQPAWTIMFADTQGYDSCLYPDPDLIANVCYRHSGGNEHSVFFDIYGMKSRRMGCANGVFLDSHVELLRAAPTNIFDVTK